MNVKLFFQLLVIAIFASGSMLALILPYAELPKEGVGFMAYCFPICGTLVAGQAIFQSLREGNESQEAFLRRSFIESLIFYFFGIVCYIVYVTWGALAAKNLVMSALLVAIAIFNTASSVVMYLGFKRDGKHPFIRSMLGALFAMISLLLAVFQFVV